MERHTEPEPEPEPFSPEYLTAAWNADRQRRAEERLSRGSWDHDGHDVQVHEWTDAFGTELRAVEVVCHTCNQTLADFTYGPEAVR